MLRAYEFVDNIKRDLVLGLKEKYSGRLSTKAVFAIEECIKREESFYVYTIDDYLKTMLKRGHLLKYRNVGQKTINEVGGLVSKLGGKLL